MSFNCVSCVQPLKAKQVLNLSKSAINTNGSASKLTLRTAYIAKLTTYRKTHIHKQKLIAYSLKVSQRLAYIPISDLMTTINRHNKSAQNGQQIPSSPAATCCGHTMAGAIEKQSQESEGWHSTPHENPLT